MHTKKEFMKLSADFKECRDVLVALGDENRLHILYQMMITADPMGMRVGDIVRLSSLSRPAVSHHMKILKDAGVINVRREGTKNSIPWSRTWRRDYVCFSRQKRIPG